MLNPDYISKKIIGRSFISEIFYFDELESTNNFAKENNLPDNSLVITDFQKKGKGRFDRKWCSESGKNLTFSIVKNFDIQNTEQVSLIFSAANSVTDTLKSFILPDSEFNKDSIKIKWPNDILINNKKTAGLLIESKPGKKMFIIGIGININQVNFPVSIEGTATSFLKEYGNPVDLNKFLVKLIKNLQNGFESVCKGEFEKIYLKWKKNIAFKGEKIQYSDSNNKILTGYVIDFLRNGQIQIEQNGNIYNFYTGEISLQI